MTARNSLRTFENCLADLNRPDAMRGINARMESNLTRTGEQFTAPMLSRYLNDPEYRAEVQAERIERQAEIAAGFDAHDRARQEAAWARDAEPDLGEPMLNGGFE